MLYFAYGSNMLTQRLRARLPSAQPKTTGVLSGWTLRFNKRSRDGSGKCSLAAASNDAPCVYGVVFEVFPNDLSALDRAENRGCGYKRHQVSPQTPNERVNAFAYVAQTGYIDDSLLPYDWYRTLVLAGTYQHELPAAYRRRLKAIRTIPDPNEKRRAEYRTMVRNAGFLHLWPRP